MRSIRMALGMLPLGLALLGMSGCGQDNEARSGINVGPAGPAQSKAQDQESYRNQMQSQQQQTQQGYAGGGYPGAK